MSKIPLHVPTVPKRSLQIFGKMLCISRKDHKWRQKDLAERIGVSRQTVARLEAGDPSVAIGIYFTAAWLLDLSLFTDIDIDSPATNHIVNQLLQLLKDKYPKHIYKPEEEIDNDF